MSSKELVIEKIQRLPEGALKEVNDFIDFLLTKIQSQKEPWEWLSSSPRIEEDFNDYLKGLLSYENMLASGKIKWK